MNTDARRASSSEDHPGGDVADTPHTAETAQATHAAHVADELPAYLTGTLSEAARGLVRRHLAECAACRQELAQWQTVAAVTRIALAPAAAEGHPTPPDALLAGIWARIDTPRRPALIAQPARATWRDAGREVARRAALWGSVLRRQVALLPVGIWVVALALVALCFVGMVVLGDHTRADAQHLALVLSLVAPLVTALGLACIYGPENDVALELALATPTSPRLVLVCRLALVLGYNVALTFAVTLAAVALRGGDVGLLTSLWMGPMLVFGGLSLALSVGVSAVAGIAAAGGVWFLRLLFSSVSLLHSPHLGTGAPIGLLWQTTPAALVLAVVLVLLAVAVAPRRIPRLI